MNSMMRSASWSVEMNSPWRRSRTFHDGEPQLDLVEPTGVGWRAVKEHVVVLGSVEEFFDQLGAVGREVVDDAVQLEAGRGLVDEVGEEGDEIRRAGVESVTQPATVPSCTFSAANSLTVPLRTYSNSRRTGIPFLARPSPSAPVGAGLSLLAPVAVPSLGVSGSTGRNVSTAPSAGTAGRVGLMRLLAWIPVFSSTDHTSAFSGGLR